MADKVAAGQVVVYATETLQLLEQTQTGLERLGVFCELIVASEQSDWRKARSSVVRKILDSINAADGEPRVILCVTQSLVRAAHKFPDGIKLPLFIDEGFVVVDGGEFISTTSAESQGLLVKLNLAKDKPEGFDGDGYQFPESMRTLVRYVENPLMIVDAAALGAKLQWNAYLDLPVFCSKFSEVTLLAACHEDTLQFHAFKAAGIKQVALDWGLATEHVTNGQVHISYVLENTEWRTTLKIKLTDEELEDIALAFEREHWDRFINVKQIGDAGNAISVRSHGFNSYSHLNHFMDLHTQMPIPSLAKFYEEKLGMSKQDIRRACYHYDRYQGALRTSLRNSKPDNLGTEDLYFCFGDKGTAEYFASKLAPEVKRRIYKLPIALSVDTAGKATYSNKVSDSPAEQKARSRDRAALQKLAPDLKRLDEALLWLRDLRRRNKANNVNTRLTIEIYKQVVKDHS
jgi:hypothetical protein